MLVCPKCGIKSTEREFIEAFCSQCYPVNIRLPENIDIDQCKQCEKVKLSFGWGWYKDRDIEAYILSKCKGEYRSAKYNMNDQKTEFEFEKSGRIVKMTRYIRLTRHDIYCPECEKQKGGYYETILQFRGPEDRVKAYTARAEKWIGKHNWVSKITDEDNGKDIYSGSFDVTMEFVKMLGLAYKLTKKLVGQKAGKRLYRSTFSIRL